MNRPRALLVALAAAAVDVGAVLVWRRVEEARHALTASIDAVPLELRWYALARLRDEGPTLGGAGAVGCLLALTVVVAGLAWARRGGGRALRAAAVVAPAAILGLASAGICRGAIALIAHQEGCGDPVAMALLRYEHFLEQGAFYGKMRVAVVAAAALASVLVLLLARRDTTRSAREGGNRAAAPRATPWAPITLFALGLCAFAATRSEAADRSHPMPVWHEPVYGSPTSLGAELPRATACEREAVGLGPAVELKDGWWFVDGVRQAGGDELAASLRAKRELWQETHPGKAFPGVIEAAIPAATPVEAAQPLFAAARAAGYVALDVLEILPERRWPTRTLGEVSYAPRFCGVRMALDATSPVRGTWGEMSAALAHESEER